MMPNPQDSKGHNAALPYADTSLSHMLASGPTSAPVAVPPGARSLRRLLLRRSPLLPGEFLSSLLVRLAASNFYPTPALLYNLMHPSSTYHLPPHLRGLGQTLPESLQPRSKSSSRVMGRPLDASTYAMLAARTGRDTLELYRATPHRYSLALTKPGDTPRVVYVPVPAAGGGTNIAELPGLNRKTDMEHILPDGCARYCPDCLAEAPRPYHRLIWSCVLVSVCPRHQRLLYTECPVCAHITSLPDVVKGRCSRCKGHLASAPHHPEDERIRAHTDAVRAQEILVSWLEEAIHPAAAASDDPPPTDAPGPDSGKAPRHSDTGAEPGAMLAHVSVRYQVAFDLSRALSYSGGTALKQVVLPHAGSAQQARAESGRVGTPEERNVDSRLARLHPQHTWEPAARVVSALARWPEGFYDLLNDYRVQVEGATPGVPGLSLAELGQIYLQCLTRQWRGLAYAPVLDAFELYFTRYYAVTSYLLHTCFFRKRQDLFDRFQYVAGGYVIDLLGCGDQTVGRLVQRGDLQGWRLTFKRAQHNKVWVVTRASLDAYKRRRDSAIDLKAACRLLGLPCGAKMYRIVDAGLLRALRDARVQPGATWLFERDTVTALLDRFAARVLKWPPLSAPAHHDTGPGQWAKPMGLASAAKALHEAGVSYVDILRLVLDGKLAAYRLPGETLKVGELVFFEPDVRALRARAINEQGWLTTQDVAKRLGVKSIVAGRWVRLGILVPVAVSHKSRARYFTQSEVERFKREYVFTGEAAQMVGVAEWVLGKWVRKGRLHPVAGPTITGDDPASDQRCHRWVFRRAEVERFARGNLLTVPALAKRLGIKEGKIYSRILRGTLKPVSGPGVDGFKQYLLEAPNDLNLEAVGD